MANESMQRQWNNPLFLKVWEDIEPEAEDAKPLLEAVAPVPGERILDVGCGGGLPTIQAAKAVAPGGHATGADLSESLLEVARSRASSAGVENVTFVKVDVQTGEIPGAPFDAVMSSVGVMFFEDFVAAFSNIRKHMTPTGRLAFVCFQGPDANPWFGGHIVAKYAPPRSSRFPPPTPWSLGDESLTREFLTEAGFTNIGFKPFSITETAPIPPMHPSLGMLMSMGAAPEDVAKAAEEIKENDKPYQKDGMMQFDRQFWLVTARNA